MEIPKSIRRFFQIPTVEQGQIAEEILSEATNLERDNEVIDRIAVRFTKLNNDLRDPNMTQDDQIKTFNQLKRNVKLMGGYINARVKTVEKIDELEDKYNSL